MGTADYADWSRLGAGCRRQDCQNGMGMGIWGCGALPHAPAGRSSPCTPGTSTTCLKATQEGEQEILEMQEIQERPCGASVKPSF